MLEPDARYEEQETVAVGVTVLAPCLPGREGGTNKNSMAENPTIYDIGLLKDEATVLNHT